MQRLICPEPRETFHLERRILPGGIGLAVFPRREHTKIEALAIFHRGAAIGIQNVALVEHRLGDIFDLLRVHCFTEGSMAFSTASMACSQLGIPRRILY